MQITTNNYAIFKGVYLTPLNHMKKQILYSNFFARLFATMLDLVIISIILTPIMTVAAQIVFMYFFGEFFIQQELEVKDIKVLMEASRTPEFVEFANSGVFLRYIISLMIINAIFMAIYFISFWHLFSATPGKMIMRLKIVDSEDYSKPSLWRFTKRFIAYVTAIIGMWSITWGNKKQAWHDKIAKTVVIKC